MSESFLANIQVLRRIAIPIEVYETLKLGEGDRVRVTVEKVEA
jgi:bifunctional DNA-binding transcriptional regulator/antitoxin component of YhaV-PrlF toxin-antitoxin module